jgi:hypothetical protein
MKCGIESFLKSDWKNLKWLVLINLVKNLYVYWCYLFNDTESGSDCAVSSWYPSLIP